MLKSHMAYILNNDQTGIRAVKFYYLLCELNEDPPAKQNPAFFQAIV